MRILAVDYGTKNIGLARASSGIDVILPFGKVSNLPELTSIIIKEKIDKLIVGLPLGLDGSENKNTQRERKIIKEIKKKKKIKI